VANSNSHTLFEVCFIYWPFEKIFLKELAASLAELSYQSSWSKLFQTHLLPRVLHLPRFRSRHYRFWKYSTLFLFPTKPY